MSLDIDKLIAEWSRAIEQNIACGQEKWAVYVSGTGAIEARPQDDIGWALFIRANAWGAQTPSDPARILQSSDPRNEAIEEYRKIIRF